MMEVLHVASFSGNIGDNANHLGFRPWFEELVGGPVLWRDYEIRDVYRGKQSFDETFVSLANSADLVVIGGGNYFELWVEKSPTGTSFSIESHHFNNVRVPILFNALGVDDGQGVTDATRAKFAAFLQTLLASDQYFVSVRNDGALRTLERHFAALDLDRICELPDGGFFAALPYARREGPRVVAVNLACDMPSIRFPGGDTLGYEGFLDGMAQVLNGIANAQRDVRYVLIPHIFSDLKIISDVLARVQDKVRREAVRVAAYGCGDQAAREALGHYVSADLAISMRFHANVVPLANGVPTIGVSTYPQIDRLFEGMGLGSSVVNGQKAGFNEVLVEHALEILTNSETSHSGVYAGVRNHVAAMRADAEARLVPWMISRKLCALGRYATP